MVGIRLTAELATVASVHGARDRRSALPSVDRLLVHALAPALLHEHGHSTVVAALRVVLAEAREGVAVQAPNQAATALAEASVPASVPPPSDDALIASCAERLALAARPRLRPVFKTGRGRSAVPGGFDSHSFPPSTGLGSGRWQLFH